MKRILRNLLLAACGVLSVVLLVLFILLPSQPDSWSRIKIGMTSEQVYQVDPQFQGMKELKGFDIMSVSKDKSYWQMQLYYDGDKISSTRKRLYHGGLGFFIYDHTSK